MDLQLLSAFHYIFYTGNNFLNSRQNAFWMKDHISVKY